MSLLAVRRCLEEALEAMEGPIATAWENVPFTPVDGTPYQRVSILAAEPDNPEMGRFTQERGFMQVNLCYPLGQGPAAALQQAERIRWSFYRGRTFTLSLEEALEIGDPALVLDFIQDPSSLSYFMPAETTVTTTIEKTPEISPALFEDDRYILPVRVRFFANYTAVSGVM